MLRFLKTKDERLQDTLSYLDANLPATAAQEVHNALNLLSADQIKTIAGNLSLGATGTSDERTANREARRAKRALMVATTLFLEDPGYRREELLRVRGLPETSEADLVAELQSWFIVPTATASDVADTAVAHIQDMPNWQNVNVPPNLAVRGRYTKGAAYEFNCYNAVVFWAFQAGVISRRFLWNKLHGRDGNAFFPIFSLCGWDTLVEYEFGEPPQVKTDKFAGAPWVVPKGMAVYFVTPHKKFGHVALSLGDGRIISQNAVLPAFKDAIKPEDQVAVAQMQQAETHIIKIKHFWKIHYNPRNGYHKLQKTATGFWEAYPAAER